MKILKYKITGTAPLLMHSDVTANPIHPITKRLKAVTSKRAKTDDDHAAIAKIEFEAGLYYNERAGYYMPSANVDATLLGSAKHFKLGTLWKQAVLVANDATFEFKHNKLTPEQLYERVEYVDMRTVKVGAAKTNRCRPIFSEWSFEVEIFLDEAKLNEHQVDEILINAGKYVGLCDYRPRFGRFDVEKL